MLRFEGFLQLAILPGGDAELLLEGPVEGGVIGKSHQLPHRFQLHTFADQGFCGNEPPLGHAAVEADPHLFAEGLGDGALADKEPPCGFLQGDLAGEVFFDIGHGPVQQRRFFSMKGIGGGVLIGAVQLGQQGDGVADYRQFPAGLCLLGFPDAVVKQLCQELPFGAGGAQQAAGLQRLGFKRQVYLSFHGPAHMTICPMIRDFYDETGVPILYMDMMMQFGKNKDLFTSFTAFHDITVGAYKLMNRIDDVPLVTGYDHRNQQSCAPFNDLFGLGYQSAAVGYCFGENGDHMATPDIPDIATRDRMAEAGASYICKMVERMDVPHVVDQLRKLEAYGLENEQKYPWMPAAWNRNH